MIFGLLFGGGRGVFIWGGGFFGGGFWGGRLWGGGGFFWGGVFCGGGGGFFCVFFGGGGFGGGGGFFFGGGGGFCGVFCGFFLPSNDVPFFLAAAHTTLPTSFFCLPHNDRSCLW